MLIDFRWFFPLLNLKLSIVEDDASSVELDSDKEIDHDDAGTEEQTPTDAVLDALDLSENTPEDSKPADEKPVGEEEKSAEENPAKDVEAKAENESEKKQEVLTDADLAPLDSKNPKTNERFQKVTEGYKQEKQRADTLASENQRLNESFDAFRQLGYSDEYAAQDLVNFSDYRKALYAGDEKTFQQIIASQIKQFESVHGRKVSIQASALDDFPDLKQKVEALEIEEDLALEVARNRKINERVNRDNETRSQQIQTEQQRQQALQESVYAVESMQAEWQKNDPDFIAILPHLRPQMEEIGKNYPPAMWPKILDLQYKSLKKALSDSRQTRGNDLPLRGNGHMGGRPAPRNPQEAVLQELGLDGE